MEPLAVRPLAHLTRQLFITGSDGQTATLIQAETFFTQLFNLYPIMIQAATCQGCATRHRGLRLTHGALTDRQPCKATGGSASGPRTCRVLRARGLQGTRMPQWGARQGDSTSEAYSLAQRGAGALLSPQI